jgi:hypothetical protein
MKLVRPVVVDRQLKAQLVLLKCENKGSNISDAKVNGEGCLLKRKAVGTARLRYCEMTANSCSGVRAVGVR